MSNWVETEEEGHTYFINEELGNIVKISDGMYVSCMPRILKFGPFGTLEEAQKVFENKADIDNVLTELNGKLMRK